MLIDLSPGQIIMFHDGSEDRANKSFEKLETVHIGTVTSVDRENRSVQVMWSARVPGILDNKENDWGSKITTKVLEENSEVIKLVY